MFDNKIHITPEDYIHDLTEKDCKDYLFIAPVGELLNNEMSDVYYQKDAFVPYHEHQKGYETFCIYNLKYPALHFSSRQHLPHL